MTVSKPRCVDAQQILPKPQGGLLPEALQYFDSLPDSANVRRPVVQALFGWSQLLFGGRDASFRIANRRRAGLDLTTPAGPGFEGAPECQQAGRNRLELRLAGGESMRECRAHILQILTDDNEIVAVVTYAGRDRAI